MSKYFIHGGQPLKGVVRPEGFKHAFVTVLSAAFLTRTHFTVLGAPMQEESQVLLSLLSEVGVDCRRFGDKVIIDIDSVSGSFSRSLFDSIHGSVYLIPGLLVHTGSAYLGTAGGCAIGDGVGGSRPISHYFNILEEFGANVNRDTGYISLPSMGLLGTTIDLVDYTNSLRLGLTGPLYSGATKFAILCAAIAEGVTEIRHPYFKADVQELIAVLVKLGAFIEVDDCNEVMYIARGNILDYSRDVTHTLIPDFIQALTWVTAGVITEGDVSVIVDHPKRVLEAMGPEVSALEGMGVGIECSDNMLYGVWDAPLKPIDLCVESQGVFSDVQSLYALLMTRAHGLSTITDYVWGDRFGYIDAFIKLGVDVYKEATGTLNIRGSKLSCNNYTEIIATDLRVGVCITLAALSVDRDIVVHNIDHIYRGFAQFDKILRELGGVVMLTRE